MDVHLLSGSVRYVIPPSVEFGVPEGRASLGQSVRKVSLILGYDREMMAELVSCGREGNLGLQILWDSFLCRL